MARAQDIQVTPGFLRASYISKEDSVPGTCIKTRPGPGLILRTINHQGEVHNKVHQTKAVCAQSMLDVSPLKTCNVYSHLPGPRRVPPTMT